jgi:hypothetical protein
MGADHLAVIISLNNIGRQQQRGDWFTLSSYRYGCGRSGMTGMGEHTEF